MTAFVICICSASLYVLEPHFRRHTNRMIADFTAMAWFATPRRAVMLVCLHVPPLPAHPITVLLNSSVWRL